MSLYLSDKSIHFFEEHGYLKVEGLFSRKLGLSLQEIIWKELSDSFGIVRDDPTTWHTPPHSPKTAKTHAINSEIINAEFRSCISQLLASKEWPEPASWGGFLFNFPTVPKPKFWQLTDTLWHFDYELFREPDLGGLLIFSFYGDVEPRCGGTLVLDGSHRLLRKFKNKLDPSEISQQHKWHRAKFFSSHPWLMQLTDAKKRPADYVENALTSGTAIDNIPIKVVELTGNIGDVVFCHPRLVHAPAGIHLGSQPRIMRTKFFW